MRLVLALSMFLPSLTYAETIAFIGIPQMAEMLDGDCEKYLPIDQSKPGEKLVCMDRFFRLRYRVEESLTAPLKEKTFEFIGRYHYWGMPNYLSYEPALVIVEKVRDHYLLRYIESVEKRDHGWWVCEEWPDDESGDCVSGRFARQIVEDGV